MYQKNEAEATFDLIARYTPPNAPQQITSTLYNMLTDSSRKDASKEGLDFFLLALKRAKRQKQKHLFTNKIDTSCGTFSGNTVFERMLKKRKLQKRSLIASKTAKLRKEEKVVELQQKISRHIKIPLQLNDTNKNKTTKVEALKHSMLNKRGGTVTPGINNTANLFQLQASGEYVQFNDEIVFYLDVLQSNLCNNHRYVPMF